MKARDIMTRQVVSVEPDTPVREIAGLLYELRISAVPVVEAGRLVGLVSEADLMHRHEIGTDRARPPGSWWLRLFSEDRSPEEYVKSSRPFRPSTRTSLPWTSPCPVPAASKR